MKRHYFQKLLHDPRGGWMQLPVFTRGIGAEILRRLDPAGGIDLAPGTDPMESLLSAVAAHPRERRRVREVMQELIDGGWLVLSGRRWEAYLPDLERARPCAETTPARAETAVSGSQPESRGTQPVASVRPLGAQNEITTRNSTNDVSQGEERRGELEEREREIERGSLALVGNPHDAARTMTIRADVIRSAVLRELQARQVVPLPRETKEPDHKHWVALIEPCMAMAERDRCTLQDIAGRLAIGFAASPKAQKRAYPIGFLVQNPGEYVMRQQVVSDFSHVDESINPADLLADDF